MLSRRTPSRVLTAALLFVCWGALADARSAPREKASFAGPIRGITISTHRGGGDWGSDAMVDALVDVERLGSNWIAIHPYAGIRADGSVPTRRRRESGPPDFRRLTRPIEEAHRLGIKILIKPHIAYWRSPFSWRGEIAFETEEQWSRFFETYERFILEIAEVTKGADAFAVGTELDKTLHHEKQWRSIIEKVRAVTDAPLTYAVNWDSTDAVPFWDALDAIGIQAYFPLSDAEKPTDVEIREGWDTWMKRLNTLSQTHDRPLLFTELGYNRSYRAASTPWEYATDDQGASELQQRCLRIALDVVETEERVLGAFLWKWFPPPRSMGRNFQLAAPGMQNVIRESWRPSSEPLQR